jgi:DNA-binding transcriptional ArsR family regulator
VALTEDPYCPTGEFMNTDRFESNAALLLSMANKHRLRVLVILAGGEATVNSMVDKIGISQSALSQHLAKLRKGNLVSTRREAQTIYYSCSSFAVLKVLDALADIYSDRPAKIVKAA